MATEDTEIVDAGETLLSLMEALYRLKGAKITDLAAELDVAKSTAYRHIATLEQNEFVIREDQEIQLSTKSLQLANYVRYRKDVFREAKPIVEELAEETTERANFYIAEHGRAVCIHRAIGSHGVAAKTKVGTRFPIHATAAGKAIMSMWPDERVEEVIDRRGLPAMTEHTITDRAALFEELRSIRQENIAFNEEETVAKLRGVGVPVNTEEKVLGALTITGPMDRLAGDRLRKELPKALLGAANELELKVAYSP